MLRAWAGSFKVFCKLLLEDLFLNLSNPEKTETSSQGENVQRKLAVHNDVDVLTTIHSPVLLSKDQSRAHTFLGEGNGQSK